MARKKKTNFKPTKKRNYWLFEGQSEENLFSEYYKECPNKNIFEYKSNSRIIFDSYSEEKIIKAIKKVSNKKINNPNNLNKIIVILDLVDIINHNQIKKSDKEKFKNNARNVSLNNENNILILISYEQIEDLFEPQLNVSDKPHKNKNAKNLTWTENATLSKSEFEELLLLKK